MLLVGLVGCKTGGETVCPLEGTEQISYESHVKKIVGKNCTGCHAEFGSIDGFKKEVAAGKVLERINNETNPMPTYGLIEKSDRKTIEEWVKNDFMEN